MDNNPIFNERRGREGQLEKVVERIEIPEHGRIKQGYLTWHLSFDYPEKGFKNDYVLMAVNNAKRLIITWIRLIAKGGVIPLSLNKCLKELNNGIEFYLTNYQHEYYLKELYYCEISLELKKLIKIFLLELNIEEELAEKTAFNFSSLIEYDTAYRYRLGDLFNETTKEKILENPKKEIKKLVELLTDRDNSRKDLIIKFKSVDKILSFILLIPKIKRAFKKAIQKIDFEKLKFDEIDRNYVRYMADYKFSGMSIEERLAKWPPKQHTFIELDYNQISDEQISKYFIDENAVA